LTHPAGFQADFEGGSEPLPVKAAKLRNNLVPYENQANHTT